jgi:hypothetical protein
MSTTALTVVNNVLQRLRESTVTSSTFSTNTYAQLVLKFVNDTKREVEDAYNWTSLRRAISFNLSSGTATYTLTGAGQRFRFVDRRKVLWNNTNRTGIYPMTDAVLEEWKRINAVNNQYPSWYRFQGESSGDPVIEVYPTPDATYAITVQLYVPETDLSLYSDTFTVPTGVVEQGAYARAEAERGEDGGLQSSEAWLLYQNELATYVARSNERVEGEMTWSVDG